MIGKITKIDSRKESRNGDVVFNRVYFEIRGREQGEKFWAKTDIVSSFRNFKYWQPVLQVGNVLEGLNMLDAMTVDADSRPEILDWIPPPVVPQKPEKIVPQKSCLYCGVYRSAKNGKCTPPSLFPDIKVTRRTHKWVGKGV